MMLSPTDETIAALTVFGEARGEDDLGRRAVAHVLLNRGRVRKHSLLQVCLQAAQFSCWNVGDPNRAQILRAREEHPHIYDECLSAFAVATGEDDFTEGATHYCTIESSPFWAVGKTPCFTHGNHKFFNNID